VRQSHARILLDLVRFFGLDCRVVLILEGAEISMNAAMDRSHSTELYCSVEGLNSIY
jgi:hypothetical protein